MNNIEILENFIRIYKDLDKKSIDFYINKAEIPIENLIQENKELKEKLEEKDMQHELELIGKEEYTKDAMGEIIEHYYTANEDCIPKSKIKEKIEELNKEMLKEENSLELFYRKKYCKEFLEELLEEGE